MPAASWSPTTGSMPRRSKRRWPAPRAERSLKMMRRPIARVGRPSVVGTVARTAVVAGTATAVVGGMSKHAANKSQQAAEAQAYEAQQQQAAMQAAADQAVANAQAAAPALAAAPAAEDDTIA